MFIKPELNLQKKDMRSAFSGLNFPQTEKMNKFHLHTVAPGGAGLALILGLFESSLADRRGWSDLILSSCGTPPPTGGVEGSEGTDPVLSCLRAVTDWCEIRGGGDVGGFDVSKAPKALLPWPGTILKDNTLKCHLLILRTFFLIGKKREIYYELYCVTLTSSFWLRFSSGGGSWSTWLLRQHMSHRPHIIGSRLRRYKIQSKKILILLALPRRFCIISQLR